jgi:hypothetical protein
MTLRLNGSTSGYTEIDAPAVAGSNTLVLPTGNGSANQALVTNGSGTLSFADRGRMTLATAQNSTSGTSIDFTGIPSWVKRVTVMFDGVSTNGTSPICIQLGDSGGIETTGYNGGSTNQTPTYVANTVGLNINAGTTAAAQIMGHAILTNISGNTWVLSSGSQISTNNITAAGGSKATSATLDRVRITTVNGTDTFDAGLINILYEG